MYGFVSGSAYFLAIGACVWGCVELADNLATTLVPEMTASVLSSDHKISRVEKRLQDLAFVPEPQPVRPALRAMTPPGMSASSLARAIDRAETARMVRTLPIDDIVVETVAAVAVAASQPSEEIQARTLRSKSRNANGFKARGLASSVSAKARRLAAGPPSGTQSTDANIAAPITIEELQPPHFRAVTPGALMFARFIRRES